MNAQIHQELLEKYIAQGGDKKQYKALERFSLSNFAKLKYELKKLEKNDFYKNKIPPMEEKPAPKENLIVEEKTRPKPFDDLIVDYPTALHTVFQRRWAVWLEACSLKISLGNLPENATEKAFNIQWKIYQLFQELDQCQTILDHYREHKRIMPTEMKKDFSQMSEMEIFKYRNNLRGLITRRKKTIEQLEKKMPLPEEKDYPQRLHHLNLKKEALQEKLTELMECDKILNHGRDGNGGHGEFSPEEKKS